MNDPSYTDAGAGGGTFASHPTPQLPPAAPARDPRTKSPLLAGILSLVPGLGQVYLGYYQRGFIHALVVASIITVLGTVEEFSPIVPFALMFLLFFWLYNVIDASRRATYVNQVVAGGSPLDVPEDFKTPQLRGSFLGGGLFVLAGLIALSNTVFGVSLQWIGTWWPLLPIGFGAYLVWKAADERKG